MVTVCYSPLENQGSLERSGIDTALMWVLGFGFVQWVMRTAWVQTPHRDCQAQFDLESTEIVINLYVSPTCTYFQWHESYNVYARHTKKFQNTGTIFMCLYRDDPPSKMFIFPLLVLEALCLTLKWAHQSCRIVGQVWVTVHWTIIFFNWILHLLGKFSLNWQYREL